MPRVIRTAEYRTRSGGTSKQLPAALIFSLADLTTHNPKTQHAPNHETNAPALVVISEYALVRVSAQLGATRVGGPLSSAERALVDAAHAEPDWTSDNIQVIAAAIRRGMDPLGNAFLQLRPASDRRRLGAFYTPTGIVEPMVAWILKRKPDRVVDAGCGSGRFAAAVIRARPGTKIVAVDLDPLATLITRATLSVLAARKPTVLNADYTALKLPKITGRTAFLGNPPYVRHHDLSETSKKWIIETSANLGHRASGLAGLHAHFFVATAVLAQPGDIGCFVTSSEWLDVGYGSVIRHLLANGLGGRSLHVIKPTAIAFAGAQTTAVVTCFEKGSRKSAVTVQLVDDVAALTDLDHGRKVPASILASSSRWTHLVVDSAQPSQMGLIPLGNLARVSRGIVTGGNSFFVMTRRRAEELGIEDWCRPAISHATEVLRAKGEVRNGSELKVVLMLPRNFDRSRHPRVDAYLKSGEKPSNDQVPLSNRYICAHRKPWWCLGSQEPPPIIATYMARQAPAFAHNPDRLAVLNIAHCVYPTDTLGADANLALAAKLNLARQTFRGRGRTYQGGLEKFEPREMEALLIQSY